MKKIGYLIGWLVSLFFLWDSTLLYPLKLLTVFFHESSHALATVLTGGHVSELIVTPKQGGHVLSSGGSRFLILSAGYLGSLFWGLAIYTSAVRSQFDQKIMVLLGFSIIVITFQFIGNLFSLVFGVASGLILIGLGLKASMKINDFLLRLIGLTTIMYVPLDIISDTILRSNLRSDARMLAEEIGGTTLIWGITWLLISIYAIFHCLRLCLRETNH